MVTHGKHLAGAASTAGVKNYGTFMNYGYMGLYGGLDSKQIHARKNLNPTNTFSTTWEAKS